MCPHCKSDRVRKISYGLIRFQDEESMKEFEKTHVLGGCVITSDDPAYHCDACGKNFGKRDAMPGVEE